MNIPKKENKDKDNDIHRLLYTELHKHLDGKIIYMYSPIKSRADNTISNNQWFRFCNEKFSV